ncbi:hypothetical protein JOW62_16495 [Escherichia coli]|uniref:hypothetical protein n=1 Tax=Enterobacteriaceae TaxID=543 RepID=UPI0005364E9D|nr:MULTISPECIES: hypothetical protein [Enterobacteriaceae]ELS4330853.1 hypothetical protein [Shigella sonnei]HAY5781675.1 hypothetical protein [Shigella flexneri 3b]ATH69106.1 hypothetical protein B7485_16290 [Shigella flexneri 1c]AUU30687.1 hypothetical protein MC63_006460 [Shigella flexneri]EAC1710302.1 hypothetical protein [Escherichia coli]
MTNNTNDTNITSTASIKIDPRTPEGRKALRLMVIPTKALIATLGLPAKENRQYYSKAALCLMAVDAGLTPRDFM